MISFVAIFLPYAGHLAAFRSCVKPQYLQSALGVF